MKNKTSGLFALSVIALALVISSVSALTLTSSPSSLTFSQIGSSQIVTIGVTPSTANSTTAILNSLTTLSGSNGASFTITNPTPTTFNITLNSISNNYGGSSVQLPINGTDTNSTGTQTANTALTLNYVKSFCASGDANDSVNSGLSMSVKITNDGSGSTYTWNPLDIIEVQVKVSNNGPNDINNMNFQAGLFNQNNGNIINNVKWISPDEDKATGISISAGSTETYTFKFQVDPSIISNQNSQNYLLMLKAYQQSKENKLCVDYSTSSDLNDAFGGFGSSSSNDYAADIQIPTLGISKAVIVDSGTLPTISQVSCGQQLTLTPTIYNVGPSDNSYSKGQILVAFSSPSLGIYQNQTLYGDLNAGNNMQAPFTFSIPLNADIKTYSASVTVYYKYNPSTGGYFNNYQYLSQNFNTLLQVTGNCVYATSDTTQVSAQLVSGGNAGQPLVIQATVANTGTRAATYNFGLEGYSSWASVSSISPLNVTIAPGQSQDVTLTLNVNPNAPSGNQVFYLDTYSSGYLITKQPIQVPITSGFRWPSITGSAISSSNWYIWAFGLLNVILVVVIIIVLVRIRSNKKSK